MSMNRVGLSLIAVVGIAASALFFGSTLSKAENKGHLDHAQHARGDRPIVPTMPGQEVFGTIQEIVQI